MTLPHTHTLSISLHTCAELWACPSGTCRIAVQSTGSVGSGYNIRREDTMLEDKVLQYRKIGFHGFYESTIVS